MARYETTRRRMPTKPGCGFLRHLLLVMIGFAVGCTSSTFFNWNEVVSWVNTHVLMQKSSTLAPVASKKYAEIPKPKFEFYTLLTQENRARAANIAPDISSSKQNVPQTQHTAAETVISESPSSTSRQLPMELTVAASQTNLALQEQRAIEKTLVQASVKNGYWLQLASFRRAQDAEKMKANLSLKGVMPTVVTITQQHVQWFRVVLGPFPNKFDAERARKSVMLSFHIQGIVRRMDA
jgi:cell division protein FtsN